MGIEALTQWIRSNSGPPVGKAAPAAALVKTQISKATTSRREPRRGPWLLRANDVRRGLVTMCHMSVMSGFLMNARLMMLGSFFVVPGRMLVMLGGLRVMMNGFL